MDASQTDTGALSESRRTPDGPNYNALRELSETVDQMAREMKWPSAKLAEISESLIAPSQKFAEMMRAAMQPYGGFVEDHRRAMKGHAELMKTIGSVAELGQKLADTMRVSSHLSSLARFEHLSSMMAPPAALSEVVKNLHRSQGYFAHFAPALTAYQKFQDTLIDRPLAEMPAPWLQPARENFLTVDLVIEAGSEREPELIEEFEDAGREIEEHAHLTLPPALRLLDSELVKPWEGAWLTLRSDNPDKIRHATVSAREILGRVLHLLAPDEQVKRWSSDPALYHKGRPTRKARFQFIAKNLSPALQEFVLADITSAIAVVEALNRGTHTMEPPYTDREAIILLRKVHCMLCTMVEMKGLSQ